METKKRGRPHVDERDKRTKCIVVRFTPAEYVQVLELASDNPVAVYIRRAALAGPSENHA